MRHIYRRAVLFCVLLIPTVTPAQTPIPVWSHRYGASDNDAAQGVAVDGSSNVFVTGRFSETANFGGTDLVSAGLTDAFLAKYDVDGVHQWSVRFGGVGFDEGVRLDVDGDGNVVVIGFFGGTINLGGDDFTNGLGSEDIFLAKFDPNGAHIWSRAFGGLQLCTPKGLDVNASGEIAIAGEFRGQVDFGDGTLVAQSNDGFVCKYDADGAHVFSKVLGSNGLFDRGGAAAIDASGNVAVTGAFSNTVDFGGGGLVSVGSADMFLAKYGPTGAHLWSQRFGSDGFQEGRAVAFDAAGSLYVSFASAQSDIVLGGGPIVGLGSDVFFAKFDAAGTHLWSRAFVPSGLEFPYVVDPSAVGLAPMSSGGVVAAGRYEDTLDFGGGTFATSGFQDAFVAIYSANGEHLGSRSFGGGLDDGAYAVAVDANDDVLVVGEFEETVNPGDGDLVSAGLEDAFVVKYRLEDPLSTLIQRFDAVARKGAVELRWNVATDDLIDRFEITRTDVASTKSLVVVSGAFGSGLGSFVDTSVQPGRTYDYVLTLWANEDIIARSAIVTATTPAFEATIGQNYPNPFNPSTTIDVTITERSAVMVEIYDARGTRVATLDGGLKDAGTHRVEWNGSDDAGKRVGSGVYFYRLSGVNPSASRKMILLK